MVSPAVAAVICTKKSGVMVVRDACKKKETQVNLADFGAVGPKGDPGQDLTVDTPLQGGQTETGVYSAEAPQDVVRDHAARKHGWASCLAHRSHSRRKAPVAAGTFSGRWRHRPMLFRLDGGQRGSWV